MELRRHGVIGTALTLKLRQGLTITREPTPSGWLLRFSGPQAKSPGLADDVMDRVEEWFGGE